MMRCWRSRLTRTAMATPRSSPISTKKAMNSRNMRRRNRILRRASAAKPLLPVSGVLPGLVPGIDIVGHVFGNDVHGRLLGGEATAVVDQIGHFLGGDVDL